MRTTQTMLASNMLRNLNNSYNKMGKLQQQIASGSRLTRPSDDPVAAIKAMGYRTDLTKNAQFLKNMDEVTGFLDATDDALSQVADAIKRVKDLVIQAANDTNTDEERGKIKQEIDQIRQQVRDIANTQSGEKYIFSGTKTLEPLFANSTANAGAGELATLQGNNKQVIIEVYNGVTLGVNTNGADLFKNIDNLMSEVQTKLNDTDALNAGTLSGTEIGSLLTDIENEHNEVLGALAQVGAKQNRVEMMTDRLTAQEVSVTKQLSINEDVDYEKVISQLITEESVHRAALSVGSRIIQPTLVDFL
ncbi:flagellar hook-associated protein FlgL [Viridibacillus sp. YIM B01967]|uniref:Flagellar hook-associated protein FlgL n=1 Tax=Viridibacillus soli TaxID=2798301 RepID=A0ABS1H6A7_9BACL|nr:flagellar hook-associated protein FlgL [Viridibacillus soli]MBK3494826.1 flagellar hook-associated protein FlgL [Viridibacillus soli]